jgi:NADH:ubiquinone oxidoreductase subunit F (NADH-binding)
LRRDRLGYRSEVSSSVLRVLDQEPVASLDAYIAADGMVGVTAARGLEPDLVIDQVAQAGLRGRGGAGFPTGEKWRSVMAMSSATAPSTVLVNAAEGEPGSFKDRAILRANPFRVLEGALIAARAVAADRVIVALKRTFTQEIARVRDAAAELRAAGWLDGIEIAIVEGPTEYLFGEETALLEVIDGGPPLPRVAPPYRHGVDEIGADTEARSAGATDLAAADNGSAAPPTLANNVETLANVPGIVANGPEWFRSVGTEQSPGTIVVTVSGSVTNAGVAEVPMGTTLRAVIDSVGGGARTGRRIVAAVSGVANAVIPESDLDVALTYEDMRAAGSGLGAAGFIVLDDGDDPVAFAHGVARFLAVESCGQCTPCKQDGLAVVEILDRTRRSDATDLDLVALDEHLATITDGARCNLALQQQVLIGSLLDVFAAEVRAHVKGTVDASAPLLVAPIVELAQGIAEIDESHAAKQPDWTYDDEDSGQAPADRLIAPAT